MVLYRGNMLPLLVRCYPGQGARLFCRENRFEAYVNGRLSKEQQEHAIAEAFEKWAVRDFESRLEERLKHFCNIIGVTYGAVRIKSQKTRWGSCSSKGNLNFNWRLVLAPDWVMDYVVVHELCHLKHLNHSKDFWLTVGSYMPEYKTAVKWLKQNGAVMLQPVTAD